MDARLLCRLVTFSRAAKSIAASKEFPILLDGILGDQIRRPFTVSYVLYSLLYHKQAFDTLSAAQKSDIRQALASIFATGGTDGSLTFSGLGLRLLDGKQKHANAPSPRELQTLITDDARPPPGIASRVIIAATWAMARWNRVTLAQNFTAIYWPQWSRLVFPKVAQAVAVVTGLSLSPNVRTLAPLSSMLIC